MNDFDDIMAKANGSNTTQTKKPFDIYNIRNYIIDYYFWHNNTKIKR